MASHAGVRESQMPGVFLDNPAPAIRNKEVGSKMRLMR